MLEATFTRLGDLAEVTVGFVGSMANEYQSDGIPFLRSMNVRPHRVVTENLMHVSPVFHRKLAKSRLTEGDVVMVRTGKPGQAAVIPAWLGEANCSDLVVIRPGPQLDSRWLSYYLNGVTVSQINGQLVGAVQQHFNVRSAQNLQLPLPGRHQQEAIAEVLEALDNKVVANDRLIQAADALVRGLVEQIADLVEVFELASLSTESVGVKEFAENVSLFSLPAFDDGQISHRVRGDTIKSSKFRIAKPCVLFSKLNPRIPRIWDVVHVPETLALASTEFVVLEPRGLSTSLLRAAVSSSRAGRELTNQVAGTSGSHQRVRPADLLALRVPNVRQLPTCESAAITALGRSTENLRRESAELVRTRDELLPLLMSGRMTVATAEREVSNVL